MAKRGALSKLSPEVAASIIATLEKGNTRSCAAYTAGISPRTLANWMARGRKGERAFDAFFASVRQAELKAEAELVANIREASKKNWQAAAWILEKRSQCDWGNHAKELKEAMKILRRIEADKNEAKAASENANAS